MISVVLEYVDIMLLIILLHLPIWGLTGADTGVAATVCTSNACFTLHLEKVSFEDARMKCEDNGGYLATTKDQSEVAELQSIFYRIDGRHRDLDLTFWIGLKLRKGDCIISGMTLRGFNWISGNEHSQYSNWEKEPRSTCTEERCVVIHYTPSDRNDLKWTDGSCKDNAFYACKFYIKGMCKPLLLAGPGVTSYTLPFSLSPLHLENKMPALPFGTYAKVSCNDETYPKSFIRDYPIIICKLIDGFYDWNVPGPFCVSEKQSCGSENGGCDHLCFDGDTGGVRCGCKEGYELRHDRVSCAIKDTCHGSPCQYQCMPESSGFSCICPTGFQLDKDHFSCIDIDECQKYACDEHFCINTQGSYTCKCKEGYTKVDGKCRDIDECTENRCPQRCLNSQGSFSCHCIAGFTVSDDGHLCIDIDECLSNRCEVTCTNTIGSFKCSCQQNFRLHPINGITCLPDPTVASTAASQSDDKATEKRGETVETITVSTVESLNESQYTNGLPPHSRGITHEEPSSKTTFGTNAHDGKSLNSWVLICVIGSVVPLLILVAVTSGIVIFRYGRSKKDSKKKCATADSYCWVSSGLETQLEKLDGSKMTGGI